MTIHRTRTRRGPVAGLLIIVAVAAALGERALTSSSPTQPSLVRVPGNAYRPLPSEHRPPPSEHSGPGREHHDALGEADGAVPDGTTVFEDGVPGVTNLEPALLGALRRAAADAADDGVEFVVESGWRSAKYQERLLQAAVAKYGSEAEAARWVATPDTSAHVSGDAVDVGRADATAWLSEHGSEHGLCQTYGNEPWHYELRPDATGRGCPPMYADPTQDPRMRR